MLIEMGKNLLENLINSKSNSQGQNFYTHKLNQLSLESLMCVLSAINAQITQADFPKDPLERLILDEIIPGLPKILQI